MIKKIIKRLQRAKNPLRVIKNLEREGFDVQNENNVILIKKDNVIYIKIFITVDNRRIHNYRVIYDLNGFE